MADYGGNLGIKVTIENHWGLAADPQNIRIILDEVNHPTARRLPTSATGSTSTCSSTASRPSRPTPTPTCMQVLGPLGDRNDVQRLRIMLAGGFKGTFALEYEEGLLNGVEGRSISTRRCSRR